MKINISPKLKKQAVVAMESTVFSHLGLPYPERKDALESCKAAVLEAGAIPAITAIFNGEVFIGLSEAQEEEILGAADIEGDNNGENSEANNGINKLAIRDIPIAIAEKWKVGVTTVSGTLAIAAQAGIKVMATGGIGGVHRSGENHKTSLDVSSDLTALGHYPLGVVCSGAKGFLDLPNTLEVLETFGVPVVGYATDKFPAFWCESSGLDLVHSVSDVSGAARIIDELEDKGAVIAAPIPSGAALKSEVIDGAIESALLAAEKEGIVGAKSTPFILKHISEATKGDSLPANLALLENNARIAGQIAVALKK